MRNPGMGHLHLHLNRNKRSIALDLKTPEGREACLRLAEGCDALLCNIRPRPWPGWACPMKRWRRAIRASSTWAPMASASRDPTPGGRLRRPDPGQAGIAALYARQSGEVPRYAPLTLADRAVGPACRHRAGVGRAACPSQRTRAAGRDSHVRGHGAHDAGRPPGRRHARPAAGARLLRAPPALRHGRRLPVPADLQRQALAQP